MDVLARPQKSCERFFEIAGGENYVRTEIQAPPVPCWWCADAITAFQTASAGTILSEGNFSTWTSVTQQAPGATSTHQFTPIVSGGNPGAMASDLHFRHDGGEVEAANFDPFFATTDPLSGNFTLTFDYHADPATDPGDEIDGVALLMEQNGHYYHSSADSVVGTNVWQTKTLNGTFNSGNFVPIVNDTGPAIPDFSGATPTRFGLFTYLNGPSGGTWGAEFDNFNLTSTNSISVSPVPEPASMGLMAVGALITLRRRRPLTRG